MEDGDLSLSRNGVEMNQQSLLAALNKFVQTVDVMDETVMIPVRLKDMEITPSNRPVVVEENNNNSLVPMVTQDTDLYSFYGLLKTIKTDLTVGMPKRKDETSFAECSGAHDGETESADQSAKNTASAFRHHLSGLFDLLHQMTETACYLTNRYESEVTQSGKKPKFSPLTGPLSST